MPGLTIDPHRVGPRSSVVDACPASREVLMTVHVRGTLQRTAEVRNFIDQQAQSFHRALCRGLSAPDQ